MVQFQPLKSKSKKKKTTSQDNMFEKLHYLSEPTLCSNTMQGRLEASLHNVVGFHKQGSLASFKDCNLSLRISQKAQKDYLSPPFQTVKE